LFIEIARAAILFTMGGGDGERRDSVRWGFIAWKFVVAMLLLIGGVSYGEPVAVTGNRTNAFDLTTTDLTILNPDTREVLGHGHYKVTKLDDAALFEGENRFLNGEYDREQERVEHIGDGAAPVLVSYRHSFFNADGSPESIDALDAKTGVLACTHFSDGIPDIRQMTAILPADTYVGSSQLMLMVGRLREGSTDLSMHTFICFPGPRIVALKVTPPATSVKWAMYPGNLVKVELIPDLGWIGAIAAPFIPKAYGWFDPADDFNYVGGLFDRFYRHRNLMMVRTPPQPGIAQNWPASH